MKKHLFASSLLLTGVFAFSQNFMKTDYIKAKRVDRQGIPSFVSFKESSNIALSQSEMLLKEALETDSNNQLILQKSENDIFGSKHEFYKQYFKGIEVAYSSYRVHSKNGFITSINGSFSQINLSTNLSELKTPEQIYHIGLSKLGNDYALPEGFQSLTPNSKLMVLPASMSDLKTDRYTYVYTMVSFNQRNVEKVFLDAVNGNLLKKETILIGHQLKSYVPNQEQVEFITEIQQRIKQSRSFEKYLFDMGNADTRYSGSRSIDTEFDGTKYILKDDSRFINTVNFDNQDYLLVALFLAFGNTPDDIVNMASIFTDDDNNWTTAEFEADKNDGALEAHWAFAQAYDFLKEEYDRDGYDNQNSQVTSFVHTLFFGDGRNAAWMALEDLGYQGGFMFIGDGDYDPVAGTGQFDVLAGMDAISHEFSHGITNAASGLVYERESGALNEGFADIWGATIEAKKAPEKEKWLIGEDFVTVTPYAIRSLENPKLLQQPDTYMGTNWQDASEGCTPSSDNDNCGVHTNSGVLNHWYYLTVEGGAGTNDNGYNFDVQGMNIKKAADLVYSVQINYVAEQSKFADVRDFTIQEAEIMYGEDSPEVQTVKSAWCAVGVTTGEECDFMNVRELNQNEISIFPNPTTDIINVKSGNLNGKVLYNIYNMSGQKLMQSELSNNKINVSILPAGVYVLTIINENKTQNFKFVKK